MTYEHILLERSGAVATVTMNRPDKRNALSTPHLRELLAAVTEVAGSDARGLVLAAAGPVFSAGHDLGEVASLDQAGVRALLDTCTELMRLLAAVPQVVLARVQGLATAAGCQLVASCDLVVAADTAAFAAPGGRGGWFCHTPMVAIGRVVGRRRAYEMALTGDAVDAATALEWGLVNRVVPSAGLDEAVADLLGRAVRGSATSTAYGKELLARQLDLDVDAAYAAAVDVMAATSQLPDAREGMASFLQRRAPRWQPVKGWLPADGRWEPAG